MKNTRIANYSTMIFQKCYGKVRIASYNFHLTIDITQIVQGIVDKESPILMSM